MPKWERPEGVWTITDQGREMVWLERAKYPIEEVEEKAQIDMSAIYGNSRRALAVAFASLKRAERYYRDVNTFHMLLTQLYWRWNRGVATLSHLQKGFRLFDRTLARSMFVVARQWVEHLTPSKSFHRRSEKVWERISKQRTHWLALLKEGEIDEVEKALGDVIQKAISNTTILVHYEQGHATVYMHTGLQHTRLVEMLAFLERMPKALRDHWTFVPGFPPRSDIRLVDLIANESVTVDEVQIQVKHYVDGRYWLAVWSPTLIKAFKERRSFAFEALTELTLALLGDLTAVAYIAQLEFSSEPLGSEALPLRELPELMAKNGHMPVTDASALMVPRPYAYRELSILPEWDKWRQGPMSGKTAWRQLIQQYWSHDTDILEEFEEDGVRAGFFILPREHLTDEQVAKLLDDLIFNLEFWCPESLRIIGYGVGKRYLLLDALLWNQDTVFKMARAFAKEYDLSSLEFQYFVACCPKVTLWEKTQKRKPATRSSEKKAKPTKEPTRSAPLEEDAWTIEGPAGKA